MQARLQAFLEAHNTLTLATTASDGSPYACALFYALGPDLILYSLSAPKTAHAQHIAEEAPIAATIENNNQDWKGIQGLQLRGTAAPCNSEEREIARKTYATRFPFIAGAETLAGPITKARYYKITPMWIRLIDNSKGFGYKEEWTRP